MIRLSCDRVVGPFLAYSSEHCFVIVNHVGTVCGYVLTAPSASSFGDSVTNNWLPYLQQKYPLPETSDSQSAAMVRDIGCICNGCDELLTKLILKTGLGVLPHHVLLVIL